MNRSYKTALRAVDHQFGRCLFEAIRAQREHREDGGRWTNTRVEMAKARVGTLLEVYLTFGAVKFKDLASIDLDFEILREPGEF